MQATLKGRRVGVVVDGGPGAFEAADLVRRLVRAGAEVRVVMTQAAEAWLPALTLETVSTHPVVRTLAELESWPGWPDLVVALQVGEVLPSGRPGWEAAAAVLSDDRARRLCSPRGTEVPALPAGVERLPADAPSETLAEALFQALPPPDLAGYKVLLTAGPTREPLDPVRFLSNPSSGKMGYALARAARRRGAEVVLVSGPVALPPPEGVRVEKVLTAEEMDGAVRREEAGVDVFIGVAAVADYRPAEVAPEKLKKEGAAPERVLRLVRTPDVLAGLSARVSGRSDRPVLVGFAAETESVEANARSKLTRKGLDLVVANRVKGAEGAFGSDLNEVWVVSPTATEALERLPKAAVADRILDRVAALLARRSAGAWPPSAGT